MIRYKLTSLFGSLGTVCPPTYINEIFPAFDGNPTTLNESECIVEFPAETTVMPFLGLRVHKWNEAAQAWENI